MSVLDIPKPDKNVTLLAAFSVPSRPGASPMSVVLAVIEHDMYPEFVTWVVNHENRSYYWGKYFGDDLVAAYENFKERCDGYVDQLEYALFDVFSDEEE